MQASFEQTICELAETVQVSSVCTCGHSTDASTGMQQTSKVPCARSGRQSILRALRRLAHCKMVCQCSLEQTTGRVCSLQQCPLQRRRVPAGLKSVLKCACQSHHPLWPNQQAPSPGFKFERAFAALSALLARVSRSAEVKVIRSMICPGILLSSGDSAL